MIDSGMIDQWMGRYWPKSDPDCWDSQSKMSTSPMSLEDTQGAFLLLFVGVGLAAMILFSETLCRRLTCRWVRKDFPFGRSWVWYINSVWFRWNIVPLDMKGCIRHFVKGQIHIFISKETKHAHLSFDLANLIPTDTAQVLKGGSQTYFKCTILLLLSQYNF